MNWFRKFSATLGAQVLVMAACVMILPQVAVAAVADPISTSATAPLSRAEFDAVVEEAQRVGKEQRRVRAEDRVRPKWQTLDRDKLARLLRMPEFAALDGYTKEPLIDQAGAWELMPLSSPSQALATWARWFPDSGIDKPVAPDAKDVPVYIPHIYYADAKWAREAGAMIALLRCYPNAAWYVWHDEPMLWAMEHGSGWDHPNAFDFGMCVRKQREDGGAPWASMPDTARGLGSAAVLERVLSQYLLDHGCTGKGPDRCLPMLHALRSLSPHHTSLVPILKAIEPEFGLAEKVTFPDPIEKRWESIASGSARGELSDMERAQVREVARTALRKVFFLSAKIPVLLDQPGEWPKDEFDKTMDVLLKLTVTMKRTEWLNQGRGNLVMDGYGGRSFADPWHWLSKPEDLRSEVAKSIEKSGREYARAPGCLLAEFQFENLPRAFWIAYATEKLEREQTSCGALAAYTGAAKLYADAAAQPRLLKPIEGLRKFIGKEGPAHGDVVNALAGGCPKAGEVEHPDPWKVCYWAAKAVADEEAKRKASEPPVPLVPPACAENMASRVAEKLGYLGGAHHEACKPMPSNLDKSIVALSYLRKGSELSGEPDEEMGSYDLDVLVVKSGTGRVLSRLLLESVYDSDAWRLSGIDIDTARYNLAPGIRAFGIRAGHSGSSRVNPGGDMTLSLFVEQGHIISRVLNGLVVAQSQGEWDTNCAGQFSETQRTIAVGKSRSKGFADLIVTSRTSDTENQMVNGECVEISHVPKSSQFTLRYDGKSYAVPKALQ